MYVTRHTLAILATSSGGAAAYTPMANGRLLSVDYSTAGTLSSTATVVASNEGTGEVLLSTVAGTGFRRRPRAALHSSSGGAIYQTTGTGNPALGHFTLANERVKLLVAGCSAAGQAGTFRVAIG